VLYWSWASKADEEMILAVDPVLEAAAGAELLVVDRPLGRIGPVLAHLHFSGDDVDADAADASRRSVKYSSTKSWLSPKASKTWAPW